MTFVIPSFSKSSASQLLVIEQRTTGGGNVTPRGAAYFGNVLRIELSAILFQQNRHQRPFCFLDKGHGPGFVEVDPHKVSKLHLRSCNQVRQWKNYILLDCAFEVAGTIFRVSSFLQ